MQVTETSERSEARLARARRPKWKSATALVATAAAMIGTPVGTGASAGDGPRQMSLLAHHEYDFGTNLAFLPGNGVVAGSMTWAGRSEDAGFRIFNVGQPSSPRVTAFEQCAGYQSVVGVLGNIVVQALDEPGDTNCQDQTVETEEFKVGVRLWDVSDRAKPKQLSFAATKAGVHTLTVVPDAKLVYGSGLGPLPIIDISNPSKPVVSYINMAGVTGDPSYETMRDDSKARAATQGCHEIGLDLGRNRAYCAGVSETQIWDITDRRKPIVLSVIRNPSMTSHHSAEVRPNGKTLVLTDEYVGGLGGPSACTAPGGSVGALWFYDITDERNPALKSWWSPPESMPTDRLCGAHNFGFFPDRDWLAAAWMERGVYVLDFTDPSRVQMVAHHRPDKGLFWDAKVRGGHVYASSVSPISLHDGLTGVPGTGRRDDLEGGGGLYVFSLE